METPSSERGAALESLVVTEFKVWLLMGDTDILPLDQSYFELGLNSLGATEIQQKLVAGLGRPINAASLFNNPTVGNLLAHLRTEVLADLFPTAPTPARTAPVGAPAAAVTALNPDSSPKDLLNDILSDLYAS